MKTHAQHARFAVSYPHGGAYLVASLVGQYIIKKYGVTGKSSVDDGLETVQKLDPHQKILIKRDLADCLAAVYLDHKNNHPNLTEEDFLKGFDGVSGASYFNWNMERVDFCEVISYENMVEYPEKWLTKILHRCIGE